LTRKVRGKTRTVHVPKELLEEVRAWVTEYARVKGLVAEVSEAGLAILRHRSIARMAAAASRRKSRR
jgi:oligoribonuclease (3'-5' exoribonuclease)